MSDFKLSKSNLEYDKLYKRYGGFRKPCIKLTIGGKELIHGDGMKLSDLEVETSTYKSGFFRFKIINAYDVSKKDFKWDDFLVPGTEAEISMGYDEKYVTVFSGIVTNLHYCFTADEGPAIAVVGMDKSMLLMKGKKSAIWENKKHSDVVKDIATNYRLKFSGTDTGIKYETVVQNHQTDYEFISYLASLNSFEMFVLGDTLYFREINKEKESSIKLTMYDNIIYADIGVDIADQIGGVCLRGYSLKKEEVTSTKKNVTALNANAKSGVALLNKINGENFVHYIYEPDLDKEKADKIAVSYLEKIAMDYVTGEIRVIGIPDLTAGRYVTVDGIWGANSKRLVYLKGVRHLMNDDGFVTYCELGGNSL